MLAAQEHGTPLGHFGWGLARTGWYTFRDFVDRTVQPGGITFLSKPLT
jgi:hypothetical protein